MSTKLQLFLYRNLSKKLRALEPKFGVGMQAVAWGLVGPMFHPSLFGDATVQAYLRSQFEKPQPNMTSNQMVERALWVLKRVNHVTDCLSAPAPEATVPEKPDVAEQICQGPATKPLIDVYEEKKEPMYIDHSVRVARYPMLLDDHFAEVRGQPPLSPVSTCVTDGVEVTVRGTFLGHTEAGDNVHNRFKYEVRIQNTSDTVMRLISRHLFFYDPNDKVIDSEVTGAGVVGDYPLLEPGEVHEYSSCTASLSPLLIMKGTFQFMRPGSDGPESFDVYVAPVLLQYSEGEAPEPKQQSSM